MKALADFAYRKRWAVLGGWIGLVVALFVLSSAFGGEYKTEFELPGSESQEAFELLKERGAGERSGFAGQVVFRADGSVRDPAVRQAMEQFFADIESSVNEVQVASPYDPANAYQISPDGKIAYAEINFSDRDNEAYFDDAETIKDIYHQLSVPGTQVELGGDLFAEAPEFSSEVFGIFAAMIILLIAFGSVLAMGLPIITALFGILCGSALIMLLTRVLSVPDFTTQVAAMIGIGVGIDYALLILTRYRAALHDGLEPRAAVSLAIDTSGRAVLFAGLTVVISLLGMFFLNLDFMRSMATGAVLAVLMTMLGALTLLPAMLGFVGNNIDVVRFEWPKFLKSDGVKHLATWVACLAAGVVTMGVIGAVALGNAFALAPLGLILGWAIRGLVQYRHDRKQGPAHFGSQPLELEPTATAIRRSFWYRWSRVIQRNPWPALVLSAGVLIVLAIPVFSMRLGFADAGNRLETDTTRRAYDLLAEGFGVGFNAPILVIADPAAGQPDQAALGRLQSALEETPGVASVAGPIPIANNQLFLYNVFPDSPPQDAETTELVHRLRNETIPPAVQGTMRALTTGGPPAVVDFSDYMSQRLPIFFAAVLILSFLLLMTVFHSVVVPLKAVIMNMLSIGASFGAMVAVFQWGFLDELLGLGKEGPIEAWAPMMLFAIVFGLSMDYEVFLLTRIREEFDRTGDNNRAVADGLAATGRVISAAAAIMVCVFGSFMLGDERALKLLGFGLAFAVLIDATIVRLVLVPSAMELLGDKNWWAPSWLVRYLPTIRVDTVEQPVATQPRRAGT